LSGRSRRRWKKAEIERAKRKPTESLDAYALYLRGLARRSISLATGKRTRRHCACSTARSSSTRILRPPTVVRPFCYVHAKINGWISVTANEIAEVTRLAQRAVELGKDDAIALAAAGVR
jgi:hypothetical protein